MPELDKVVIVGGGVGGCAVALALRGAGVQVEIHEKYGDFQGRATGFSIWAYAIKRLLDFGFGRDRLQRIGTEMVRQDIYSQEGELTMSLPVGEVSATVGAPTMDVDRRRLQEEIVDLLGEGVYRFDSEVEGVGQDDGSATAQLADGSTATGDLVIAADGIRSIVRDSFNDPPDFQVSSSDVLEGVAEFEHPWLEDGHHVQVWGRGRRAGIGALGEGRGRCRGGRAEPDREGDDRTRLPGGALARRARGAAGRFGPYVVALRRYGRLLRDRGCRPARGAADLETLARRGPRSLRRASPGQDPGDREARSPQRVDDDDSEPGHRAGTRLDPRAHPRGPAAPDCSGDGDRRVGPGRLLHPQGSSNGRGGERGHQHGAGRAPLTDGIDLEQFDPRQVRAEAEPDEREQGAGHAPRLATDRERGEDQRVADQAEQRDRHARELGVARVLHPLAAPTAARAERLESGVVHVRQVAGDRQAGEGQRRDGEPQPPLARLPPGVSSALREYGDHLSDHSRAPGRRP